MSRRHSISAAFLAMGAVMLLIVALAPSAPADVAHAKAGVPQGAQATHADSANMPAEAPAEQSKLVLNDMSVDGPALWTSNANAPNLGLASVLAWTGTNAQHSLNIMESSDGVHYGGKVTFAESSATRPAVAAQGVPTTVVLAWTGTDSIHSLNLLCRGPACGVGYSGARKFTLPDTSIASPGLTTFGAGFLLAWTGTDARHSLNVMPFNLTTTGSGFQLGAKRILGMFSSVADPSVAVNPHTKQVLLSWSASTPLDELMFATSTDGIGWSGAQSLNEASGSGPHGFAVSTISMPAYWMTWTGMDRAHSVNVRYTQSFPQWPVGANMTTLPEAAFGGTVLGYVGETGVTTLAWTGTDAAHHMNIALLTGAGVLTLDQRISAYVAGLSQAQLIGQTLMMAICASSYTSDINQALTQWDVGGAIIYTSCNGGPTQPPTAAGLAQLNQTMQANANRAGSLLIGIDEEGGTVDRLAPYYGATPAAWTLGQSGNPQNAYTTAQTDAAHMRSVGLNLDFAPVADVYQSQFAGIGSSRTFGTTAGAVTTYAGAFLAGLQQQGVAGALKHWPVLGASNGNPDYVLPTIYQSQGQMQAIDFPPYSALLYQAPAVVMVTTVMAPAYDSSNPALLSPALVSGVLRGQIGYQGVVVTDSLGAQGLVTYMNGKGGIPEAAVRALLAGDDLLLCPLSQTTLSQIVAALTTAVSSGRISQTQLHASVRRIIRLKVELGLMTLP